jgi:hypothetical protein
MATFVSNFISDFVKILLLNLMENILGQFAFVIAKQPSAPMLSNQKFIFYKFSARIIAIYLHSSFPKDLLQT